MIAISPKIQSKKLYYLIYALNHQMAKNSILTKVNAYEKVTAEEKSSETNLRESFHEIDFSKNKFL